MFDNDIAVKQFAWSTRTVNTRGTYVVGKQCRRDDGGLAVGIQNVLIGGGFACLPTVERFDWRKATRMEKYNFAMGTAECRICLSLM
ncbi:Hypothetical protein NTJ_11143 [Nesidiocoris tenuis]|uniref:Peptidase A1 domain-containing protein n=1 Tax=Nesidiocoris tenuis TaxID=355587 RepID=A0ABN7B3X3_9HEMI|nr:Hypothetical protein NTJ_11143 [Nesidiocoris tenuis]